MFGDRNHSDYLQRAAIYDLLAQYYKYTNPNLHIHYYLKHVKSMNKAFHMRNNQHLTQAISQEAAKVRFLHTSPDAPNVDIYVNGQIALKNLPFKQVSNYVSLKAGKYHIDIYPAGNMIDSVLNKKITVEAGKSYTLATIDSVKKLRLLVYENQPEVPANEAKMRFIHLAPITQAVDIAVKERDVVFPNVQYKQSTEYLGLTPMTVDLELREAGSKNILLPLPKAQFRANETYTIVFIGLSEGSPELQAIVLTD